MRILCLGAGVNQIRAIRQARAKGYEVIVSDYLPDAPGLQWADHFERVSTFDVDANIEVARKYKINGVFAIGTDQPVYTAACVADALGIPHMITPWTALRATNKKYMKQVFTDNHIPCCRHIYIHKNEAGDYERLASKLAGMNLPIVIKPIDSQGQRGIYKINDLNKDITAFAEDCFRCSRSDEIIAEEYFNGDEITVSAWVSKGQATVLMITDRPLINIEPRLGTPDGHIYPSVYWAVCRLAVESLIERICRAFRVENGPLYVQMLVSQDNIKVVEIACRIGGGHEEELIPLVTGWDIVDMIIDLAVGKIPDVNITGHIDPAGIKKHAMVKFIVARPGRVKSLGDLKPIKAMPGVINAGFYDPRMEKVEKLTDSTRRIGYLLIMGDDLSDLQYKTRRAYEALRVFDHQGENLVVDTEAKNGFYRIYD